MKFCTDCRHYTAPEILLKPAEWGRCTAPQNVKGHSPVDGSPKLLFNFCQTLRDKEEYDLGTAVHRVCGPAGLWHQDITR